LATSTGHSRVTAQCDNTVTLLEVCNLENSEPVIEPMQRFWLEVYTSSVTNGSSLVMIRSDAVILSRLNDPYPVRLVDVTEARLESCFRKALKMPHSKKRTLNYEL
jgi:hypothetical protein